MSEKLKLNIEGDTYVIPGEDPYNPVEVREDGDWNDMVPYKNEATYISPEKVSKESISRIKAKMIGESILSAVA